VICVCCCYGTVTLLRDFGPCVQGFTNPGRQVAGATKFFRMADRIFSIINLKCLSLDTISFKFKVLFPSSRSQLQSFERRKELVSAT
jgi:hypothetical protein